MSEMPESTPAADAAAPTPTAEIASQAFDAFESGTDPGDENPAPVETAPAEPPAPVVDTPTANPEDTEIEALLAEFGFKDARKPDGREHYIPRSKVLKMIGSGLKRGQEKWTTERGVLEQQAAELRSAVEQIASGIHGEPEALLAELATLNPAFQRFLQTGQAPQAPPSAEARPEPDLDLGNGQRTYSPEGLEKLLQWQVRHALDQRLTPIERQVKERERAQQEQAQYAAIQTTIQKATEWPGFGPLAEDGSLTPFQQAVLDKLREDSQQAARERRRPSMSFRQAYLEVYAEKMTADSGRMRETVLREVAQAPKAPALSRSAGEAPKVTGPRTTADAAARALSRLERGA